MGKEEKRKKEENKEKIQDNDVEDAKLGKREEEKGGKDKLEIEKDTGK